MRFQALDFFFIGLTSVVCAIGLFRGLSGFLAFLTASAATAVAEMWLWPGSNAYFHSTAVRVAVFAAGGLVLFGLVRIVVRKTVNGLLAQPADSIAGVLVAAACSALIVVASSRFGIVAEHSALAREVALHVW